MGEIGYDRLEYLYDLTFCDLLLIERGYERRHCHLWSAARWGTYYIMCAQVGGKQLAESGIHCPQDLLPLPWDMRHEEGSSTDMPTGEDVQRLRQLMMEENARAEAAGNASAAANP